MLARCGSFTDGRQSFSKRGPRLSAPNIRFNLLQELPSIEHWSLSKMGLSPQRRALTLFADAAFNQMED
eukprot:4520762-Pyramimonas_sp.AAC.1